MKQIAGAFWPSGMFRYAAGVTNSAVRIEGRLDNGISGYVDVASADLRFCKTKSPVSYNELRGLIAKIAMLNPEYELYLAVGRMTTA